MKTYIIVDYDVWGNEKDGYEINQEFHLGTVEIPNMATDKQILNILEKNGYLKSDLRKIKVVDWAEGRIEIFKRKGEYPMYGLINRWWDKEN